ncbi:MAG: tetratricopeptide repeat protein, partial [Aureispira sp.]
LNNLAVLQSDQNDYGKAEKAYLEALEIYQRLAKGNPNTYLPDLAMTQINMSIFYQESKVDKERSIQLADAAITNLLPFRHIPYIQTYLQNAVAVLQKWDIDVETYMEQKLKNYED